MTEEKFDKKKIKSKWEWKDAENAEKWRWLERVGWGCSKERETEKKEIKVDGVKEHTQKESTVAAEEREIQTLIPPKCMLSHLLSAPPHPEF